jgi:hypothetical protein
LDPDAFDGLNVTSIRSVSGKGAIPPPTALKNLAKRGTLRQLVIGFGDRAHLDDGIFEDFSTIEQLNIVPSMGGNRLESIADGTFQGLETNLKRLIISVLKQNDFPTVALSKLTNLENIEFEDSSITNIPVDAFKPFTNLKVLDFNRGALLNGANEDGAFLSLPQQMDTISMEENGLLSMPKTSVQSLGSLSLSGNEITNIAKGDVPKSLQRLEASKNPITSIEMDAIALPANGGDVLLVNTDIDTIDLAVIDWSNNPQNFGLEMSGKSLTISDLSKVPETVNGTIFVSNNLEMVDKSIGDLVTARNGISFLLRFNNHFQCEGSEWMAYYVLCTSPSLSLPSLDVYGTTCSGAGEWSGKLLSDYLKAKVPDPC